MAVAWSCAALAQPCGGLQAITPAQVHRLVPVLTRQAARLDASAPGLVHPLGVITDGAWRVFLVQPTTAEAVYLWYDGPPSPQSFVTSWGGTAAASEADALRQWARSVGAPARVAACFAQVVTGAKRTLGPAAVETGGR